MVRLFVLLIFIVMSMKAFSQSCLKKIEPVVEIPRDQGKDGDCWIYAASTLYKGYYCKGKNKNKEFCKNPEAHFDIADMTSCTDGKIGVMSFGTGGFPRRALKCAIGKGVCPAKKGHFEDVRDYLFSTEEGQQELKACIADKSRYLCSRKVSGGTTGRLHFDKELNAKLFMPLDELKSELVCTENKHLMTPKESCLHDRFITNECKDNRLILPKSFDREVKQVYYDSRDKAPQKEDHINKILNKGAPVIISVCLEKIQDPKLQKSLSLMNRSREKQDIKGESCLYPHAITITGRRCQNGKNEYFIQNSWGSDPQTPLQGYTNFSKISN